MLLIAELVEYRDLLQAKLEESIANQLALEKDHSLLSGRDDAEHADSRIHPNVLSVFLTPYFKDIDNFAAPLNAGELNMSENGY